MKNRGLTFLEVIIAMGIFSFIIFSIGVLIPLAQVNTFRNTNQTTAFTLADNMMEKIRALNYDDIEINADYKGSGLLDQESPTPACNEDTYYQFPPRPYPGTTVEIYYPGKGNNEVLCHSVVFTYDIFACYDKDENGINIENLKKVTIIVKWLEPGRISHSRKEEKSSVTLSSKILKR
ncbi:MAG: hypothetical protein AB9903_00095 [Vulcanimicrobiota bacterium]